MVYEIRIQEISRIMAPIWQHSEYIGDLQGAEKLFKNIKINEAWRSTIFSIILLPVI